MITATDLWKGRIFLPAFLAVLSAGASPVLGQQAPRYPDPARLLEKSIIAARLLNVEGRETLVVAAHSIYGTQFLKRSILRSSKGHSLITWLNENGKAGSFVYEDGEWSNFFDPRTGQLKVTRCLPRNESPDYAARHVRLMMRNYAPKIAGTAPMAGRDCYEKTSNK